MTEIEDIYVTIAARIRQLREARGFTQQDLADAVGLSRPAIVNIETGRQRVMVHHIIAISDFLGVPRHVLILDEPWQANTVEQIAEAFDAY